ncbi:hypothetical protein FI667_g8791, partial [Globisporangium splendens]
MVQPSSSATLLFALLEQVRKVKTDSGTLKDAILRLLHGRPVDLSPLSLEFRDLHLLSQSLWFPSVTSLQITTPISLRPQGHRTRCLLDFPYTTFASRVPRSIPPTQWNKRTMWRHCNWLRSHYCEVSRILTRVEAPAAVIVSLYSSGTNHPQFHPVGVTRGNRCILFPTLSSAALHPAHLQHLYRSGASLTSIVSRSRQGGSGEIIFYRFSHLLAIREVTRFVSMETLRHLFGSGR